MLKNPPNVLDYNERLFVVHGEPVPVNLEINAIQKSACAMMQQNEEEKEQE